MNEVSVSGKVSDDFKRRIVDCINMALHDDLPRYLAEYHPETTNGIPHQINDWINTNITVNLTSGDIETITFSRYNWKGKLIVDRHNHITFSVMRGKRVRHLRTEKREKPHYLQTIIAVLNDEFVAPSKQATLFDLKSGFDKEMISKDFDSIMQGRVSENDGFIHCVIAYETERNEITDIKIVFLDKDLDEIEQISLNDFIKPDYAKLTSVAPVGNAFAMETQNENIALITIKRVSPIQIKTKEEKKQS